MFLVGSKLVINKRLNTAESALSVTCIRLVKPFMISKVWIPNEKTFLMKFLKIDLNKNQFKQLYQFNNIHSIGLGIAYYDEYHVMLTINGRLNMEK